MSDELSDVLLALGDVALLIGGLGLFMAVGGGSLWALEELATTHGEGYGVVAAIGLSAVVLCIGALVRAVGKRRGDGA